MQPIRYVRMDDDGYSVRYRGREFGRLWRDDDWCWWVEFDPAGYADVVDWGGHREARRVMRRMVESHDLYTWWGLHTGAKEG